MRNVIGNARGFVSAAFRAAGIIYLEAIYNKDINNYLVNGVNYKMTNEEFRDLRFSISNYKHVEQKNRDAGGGIITLEEIDRIDEYESFDKVMISGLKQKTFEHFVLTHGYKFNAIMFWKNKLVEDWSALSTLKNIKFIGYFHNQRITRLWNMSDNESLEGLYISDFTRLHTLEGIKKAPKLERLYFGDAIWKASILNDLMALEDSKLKEFTFGGKTIVEEDISIYLKMPNLEILNFRSNLYTTEQIAWLVAKLPKVQGTSLNPYIKYDTSTLGQKDILICGKRKPFLSSEQDKEAIQKYANKFEELVNKYRTSNSEGI